MQIQEVKEITDELLTALQRLVPQLSPGATPPARDHLETTLSREGCQLLVARDDTGAVVGALTLVAYPIPTGWRWWIEDVVVDHAARGRGIGEALVRAALGHARRQGAAAINLTSNPSRLAANRLYRRIGFHLRETNAYRFVF